MFLIKIAHPFDFVPYVDIPRGKVLFIDNLPTHSDYNAENRNGNICPKAPNNYNPEVLPANFLRKDVHPVLFVQPQGAGYQIRGNEVSWQKFNFHVRYVVLWCKVYCIKGSHRIYYAFYEMFLLFTLVSIRRRA